MDEYVMHMTRSNLLEVLLEDLPITAKKTTVSRMMYAARNVSKENDKERLTEYHKEVLEQAAEHIERVSGFLLIYPTCCLHLVEAETPVLIEILKVLDSDTRYIDSVSVFSFTEDVPYRLFMGWMNGFIISANLGPYEAHPRNTLVNAMSEFNINMLKWGKQLSEMDREQQTVALESIRTAAEELLPDDAGIIYGIILCEDVPKLKEVLELFDKRQATIMYDADLVWPKPQLPGLGLRLREEDWPEHFANPWCCSRFVSYCTAKRIPLQQCDDLRNSLSIKCCDASRFGGREQQGSSCCLEAACLSCISNSSGQLAGLDGFLAKAGKFEGLWARVKAKWRGMSKIQDRCLLVLDKEKLAKACASSAVVEKIRGFVFVPEPSVATTIGFLENNLGLIAHSGGSCVALVGWDEGGWIIEGTPSKLSYESNLSMILVLLV
ncbi:hypothetical protein SELMODRAFT_406029 [Selaginella moellendorffii]|uniref:Uncharacterized protein n=1 Tax=Selaginella moellendorffii TaxID=88036 RepID=D8R0F5_SELML|nr:hypothetical protein SELMODRAFT_406029 [Selaginella moellendorffii]